MYCSSVISCSQLRRNKVFRFYSAICQLSKNRVRPLLRSTFQFFFFLFLLFFFFFAYLPSPIQDLHPQGQTIQMPVGQMPVGGATVSGPEHYTGTQGRASLNVWSAQCQGLRRKQHRIEHRQRKEIEIPDPAGLEGRDSNYHATANSTLYCK